MVHFRNREFHYFSCVIVEVVNRLFPSNLFKALYYILLDKNLPNKFSISHEKIRVVVVVVVVVEVENVGARQRI